MRVVTYNVLADCTLHHFPNPAATVLQRYARTPLIIEYLTSSNADIICLQEVDQIMYNAIQKALFGYAASHLSLNKDGRFGCAMFSKVSHIVCKSFYFNDDSGRVAQIAKIGETSIINVHLDFKKNHQQIRELVKEAGPNAVLCGDFNASFNSGTLRIAQEAGFGTLSAGPTINTNGRAKVIDFILTRGKAHVTSLDTAIQVEDDTQLPSQTQGSDHVAVIAEIKGITLPTLDIPWWARFFNSS